MSSSSTPDDTRKNRMSTCSDLAMMDQRTPTTTSNLPTTPPRSNTTISTTPLNNCVHCLAPQWEEETEIPKSTSSHSDDDDEDAGQVTQEMGLLQSRDAQLSIASVSSKLSQSLDASPVHHCTTVAAAIRLRYQTEDESRDEGDGSSEGGCTVGGNSRRSSRGDIEDQEQHVESQGETLEPATEVVVVEMQQKGPAVQPEECILDYPGVTPPDETDNADERVDILAPHAPFLQIFSPTTLQPQRFTKIPVVREYIDYTCPPTPPTTAVELAPTSLHESSATGLTTEDSSTNVNDDKDQGIKPDAADSVVVVHKHIQEQDMESRDNDILVLHARNPNPCTHQFDPPPSQSPHNSSHESVHSQTPSLHQEQQQRPEPLQQQRQPQPDRVHWRVSTNYPPSNRNRRPERNNFMGSFHGNYNNIEGDTASIRSSMNPTMFVMIDTDGNQILTDPYTSSLTPPRLSPLSTAVGISNSEKTLPPVSTSTTPFWFANALPHLSFSGSSTSTSGTRSSSGGGRLGNSINSSGIIRPATDPEVAAHIAEALRMYGIPNLSQSTTIHPYQRLFMPPILTSAAVQTVSEGSSTASGSGAGGNGPSRMSMFPRLGRSTSQCSSSSGSISRVGRVWAALTGRARNNSAAAGSTSGGGASTNTSDGSTTSSTTIIGTPPYSIATSTTATATPSALSRSIQTQEQQRSALSLSRSAIYEQLPFVQQPQRPTIILNSRQMSVSARTSTGRSTVVGPDNGEADNTSDGAFGNASGYEGREEVEGGMQPQEEFTLVLSPVVEYDAENDESNENRDIASAATGAGAGEPSMGNKILRALMCGC